MKFQLYFFLNSGLLLFLDAKSINVNEYAIIFFFKKAKNFQINKANLNVRKFHTQENFQSYTSKYTNKRGTNIKK